MSSSPEAKDVRTRTLFFSYYNVDGEWISISQTKVAARRSKAKSILDERWEMQSTRTLERKSQRKRA